MLSLQRDIRKLSKYGQPGTSFQSRAPAAKESDAGSHDSVKKPLFFLYFLIINLQILDDLQRPAQQNFTELIRRA
jgi:hypothetical protein